MYTHNIITLSTTHYSWNIEVLRIWLAHTLSIYLHIIIMSFLFSVVYPIWTFYEQSGRCSLIYTWNEIKKFILTNSLYDFIILMMCVWILCVSVAYKHIQVWVINKIIKTFYMWDKKGFDGDIDSTIIFGGLRDDNTKNL